MELRWKVLGQDRVDHTLSRKQVTEGRHIRWVRRQ